MAVPVGRTDAPTVKYGTSATAMNTLFPPAIANRPVNAGTYYINATGSAENIYINGAKVTSGEAYEFQVNAGETKILRIIAQDGSKEPSIRVISFTGQ